MKVLRRIWSNNDLCFLIGVPLVLGGLYLSTDVHKAFGVLVAIGLVVGLRGVYLQFFWLRSSRKEEELKVQEKEKENKE